MIHLRYSASEAEPIHELRGRYSNPIELRGQKAASGARTRDILLGKQAFYH